MAAKAVWRQVLVAAVSGVDGWLPSWTRWNHYWVDDPMVC